MVGLSVTSDTDGDVEWRRTIACGRSNALRRPEKANLSAADLSPDETSARLLGGLQECRGVAVCELSSIGIRCMGQS